jgi:DNA-binding transcriptional LysR family regulator
MDFDRLKTFLLLAELKSFTEVAHQLYISQPAVSKQIKALENELGVPLFSRVGQKNHLTIQGESFKQYAQTILNTYAIAKEQILQIENLEQGNIHFGATNFIGVYLMPDILSLFRNKFPNIDINFSIASSKKLMKQFDNATIEFAVLSGYVRLCNETYVTRTIFNDELKVIVSKEHKFAGRNRISFDELENETFILKSENSSLYRFLLKRIGEAKIKDKNILTISNQEGIKESVIKNLGISFMSEKAVKYELELGHLKMISLDDYDLARAINLVYKRKHKLTTAAKEFIKCIDESNQDFNTAISKLS